MARRRIGAPRSGLLSGSSAWKQAVPTVMVQLDRPRAVTGWLMPSRDPDGDNLSI